MIAVPAWAAVLVIGLLPVVGLVCYLYGWKLHNWTNRRIYGTRTTREMTPEEQAAFDRVMGSMNETFAEMDNFFAELGKRS